MTNPVYEHPEVQAALSALETRRKKIAHKRLRAWAFMAFGIAILLSSTLVFEEVGVGIHGGLLGFIPGGFLLYQTWQELDTYQHLFKRDIISKMLTGINSTLVLAPDQGIPQAEFEHSQLFSTTPERYSSEDLITGRIDKTPFYFAEVHAEYKTETTTKNGKNTNWHDLFKGIIFVADFNKHFNGVTILKPKDLGNRISAWFSTSIFNFGDKDLLILENQYFQDHFIAYGTDQVESRYILTPSLMEKISILNERVDDCVSISFTNSNMYIAFTLERNYFEPPTFKSLLDPEVLENDLYVLEFMCEIVHEMDLNTRIWTKS